MRFWPALLSRMSKGPRRAISSRPASRSVASRVTAWARTLAQPYGAGLGRALEGLEVHRHQAEVLAVAGGPLEIVEQRPVEVAVDLDAFVHALAHAVERLGDEGDAAAVVLGGDAALGHIDRLAFEGTVRPADGFSQRLGPELIAGGGHLRALGPADGTLGVVAQAHVS